MKYAALFLTLGIALIVLGIKFGGLGWLLVWTGVSFVVVGAGYGGLGPRIFGKNQDGKIASWAIILLFPYLVGYWTRWYFLRLINQEDCANEIVPGIWVGRRALPDELPENISLIVDFAAEISEEPEVIANRTYIYLPTLDATVPEDRIFKDIVKKVFDWDGNVYIHCAFGHGRSVAFAAAVLMTRGLADNVEQAEEIIKKVRPRVKLSQVQINLLNRVIPSIKNDLKSAN